MVRIGLRAGDHGWDALGERGNDLLRSTAWSGRARPDGMPHEPQRARSTLGTASGRPTSRSIEKPGEVLRTYLLVNRAALPVGAGCDAVDGRVGCKPDPVTPQAHDQPHGAPGHTSTVLRTA